MLMQTRKKHSIFMYIDIQRCSRQVSRVSVRKRLRVVRVCGAFVYVSWLYTLAAIGHNTLKRSTFYFTIHNQSKKQSPKIKRHKKNVFSTIYPWFIWRYNQSTIWKQGYSKQLVNLRKKLDKKRWLTLLTIIKNLIGKLFSLGFPCVFSQLVNFNYNFDVRS